MFAWLLLNVFILRAITWPEARWRTLNTSEKKPDPIFSQVKSSKRVSLEKGTYKSFIIDVLSPIIMFLSHYLLQSQDASTRGGILQLNSAFAPIHSLQ